MANPSSLSNEQSEKICLRGNGPATCAFLMFGRDGFECSKNTDCEGAIRRKLAEGTMKSKGDICSGPPDFTPMTA